MDNTVIEVVKEEQLLKVQSRCILLLLLLVVKDPKSHTLEQERDKNKLLKSSWKHFIV